jgi:hypothetical protein
VELRGFFVCGPLAPLPSFAFQPLLAELDGTSFCGLFLNACSSSTFLGPSVGERARCGSFPVRERREFGTYRDFVRAKPLQVDGAHRFGFAAQVLLLPLTGQSARDAGSLRLHEVETLASRPRLGRSFPERLHRPVPALCSQFSKGF